MSLLRVHVLGEAQVIAFAGNLSAKDLRNYVDRGMLVGNCQVIHDVRRYNFLAALQAQAIAAARASGFSVSAGMVLGSAVEVRAEQRESQQLLGSGKEIHVLAYRFTVKKGARREAAFDLKPGRSRFVKVAEIQSLMRSDAWKDAEFSVYPADARIDAMYPKFEAFVTKHSRRYDGNEQNV